MLQLGEMVCGKYRIEGMIGKGGMSTVYLATDPQTNQRFAIKDVERSGQGDNELVVQSLAAEGNMLKRLSNPHLPRIYDVLEQERSFMLVMDYVEGESMDKVLARTGAQPQESIYSWGIQICEVFDYLHNQTPPVIYRDMKPANVILQPNGNIMMIDFGTARTQKVGQFMQSDTVCIGTVGFAAPEQYGGISQSDARTDIFCLGATLYNLYTGHNPCDPPKGIQPLSRFNPALENTPLDLIIRKCTRNDPNERYQTALELKADLELAQSGALSAGKRGRTGLLRKSNDWQTQKVKSSGNSGGLSGLLGGRRNRTADTAPAAAPANAGQMPQAPVYNSQPQQPAAYPAPAQQTPVYAAQPQPVYTAPAQPAAYSAPAQPAAYSGQQQPAPANAGYAVSQQSPAAVQTYADQQTAAPAYQPQPTDQTAEKQSFLGKNALLLILAIFAAAMLLISILLAIIDATAGSVLTLLLMIGAAAAAMVLWLKGRN